MIQKDPLTQAIAEAARKILMGEDSAGAFPAQMGMTPVYVNKKSDSSADDEAIDKQMTAEESGAEYTGADQIVPAEHPGPKVANAEDSQGNDVKEEGEEACTCGGTDCKCNDVKEEGEETCTCGAPDCTTCNPEEVKEALSDEEISDKVQAIFNRFGILDQDYEEDIEAAIERLSKKSAIAAAQVKSLLKDSVNEANILGAKGIDDTLVSPKDSRWQALHDLKQSGYSGEKQDAAAEISAEPTRPMGKGGKVVKIDGQEDAEELANNANKGVKKALAPSAGQGASDKGEALADTTGSKPGKATPPSKQNNPAGQSLPDTTGNKNPKAQPPKRGATASDPMPKLKVESLKQFSAIEKASLRVMLGEEAMSDFDKKFADDNKAAIKAAMNGEEASDEIKKFVASYSDELKTYLGEGAVNEATRCSDWADACEDAAKRVAGMVDRRHDNATQNSMSIKLKAIYSMLADVAEKLEDVDTDEATEVEAQPEADEAK